jgi:hypothetical protein
MKRSFSFTEKPVLFILKSIPSLLPGIEKAVAIYYSHESKRLLANAIRNESTGYMLEELSLEDSGAIMRKLRTDNSPYSWLMAEDLPFEIRTKQRVQLNIFNELNNNILLVRIPNEQDGLSDLFFIYFNQNLANFGIVSNSKSLSTENKTIIAHILRSTIQTIILTLKEDRELFAGLHENTRALLSEINTLKNELETTKAKFNTGFIRLCQNYLLEISQKHDRIYRLSESAVEKLKLFEGDFNALKNILERAANFAESFALDSSIQEILIADFHIIITDEPQKKVKEPVPPPPSDVPVKYSKTLVLLDKLENAALNVKSKNKMLTSANIGNEFPTPITPPAISDALKKHRAKILFLFKEYPRRWEIIRSEFRPIQNILNVRPELKQLSA